MPTYGIYQRTSPRVQVLSGYWANEPYARRTSAPVTANVTILSGQLISLSAGAWVLGCAAGLEPHIALQDSVDTDVASSGQLIGLSCAGQFEIQTGYYDSTQVYVNSSPLKAATGGGSTYQGTGVVGQITLGTFATAEDTIGFASGGGVQNIVAINSEAAPNANGALNVLQFRTQWLPRATTSS